MKRIISMLLLVAAVALLLSAETDKARISYYWPPKGGTNCARYVDGWCRSKTASGMPWEAGLWWIAACPPEFPFGTVMLVGWRPVICMDRGGAIRRHGDWFYLDLLQPNKPVDVGKVKMCWYGEQRSEVLAASDAGQISGWEMVEEIERA